MSLLIVTLFLVTIFTNLLFQLGQLDLSRLYWMDVLRHGRGQPTPPLPPSLPTVTIQLPMYNESAVAERMLDAVVRIRYPRELLQIQVLDDSTDHCSQILKDKIAALQAADPNLNFWYRHRTDRSAYKAGNLNSALPEVTGELLAIFDADFVPQPDFLEKTIPHFADPTICAVQSRWGHLNAGNSFLTRVQEFYLDGHHTVEQRSRSEAGLYLIFNGSAGIWRTAVLRAENGWRLEAIAEDIDMSYAAQIRGHRIKFLEDNVVPAELVDSIIGFRTQIFRWWKGNTQTSMRFLGRVWQQPVSLHKKLHASVHLLGSAVMPSMLINLLACGVLPLVLAHAPEYSRLASLSAVGLLWFPVMLLFFGSPRLRFDDGPMWLRAIKVIPRAVGFLTVFAGLSCQCTVAILEACLGLRNQWVVTPKGFSAGGRQIGPRARVRMPWYFWLDALVIAYLCFSLTVAVRHSSYALILFETVWLVGYGYLFGGSLLEAYFPASGQGVSSERNESSVATAMERLTPEPPTPRKVGGGGLAESPLGAS